MKAWQAPELIDLNVKFTAGNPNRCCNNPNPPQRCNDFNKDCPYWQPKNAGKGVSGYCTYVGGLS